MGYPPVVAGVVGWRSGVDAALVSRQVALFFVPSLLQVDLADCERLATAVVDPNRTATSASAAQPGDPAGDGAGDGRA